MNTTLLLDTATGDWQWRGAFDNGNLTLWRGDLIRLLVRSSGGNRPDFTWATQGFLGVKTLAAYNAGGDFVAGVASSLDDTNPDADFANGIPAWAAVLTSIVATGNYVMAPILLDSAGNRQHLGAKPIRLTVEQDIFTGSESNIPSGIVTPILVNGTVLAGNDSVDINVTGMTSTGRALPFFPSAPVSTIGATCGTGKITVQLGGTMASDTPVSAYILRKSA